jgi:hypothetical protein
LARQGEYFMKNFIYLNENDEHAPDFAPHLSRICTTLDSVPLKDQSLNNIRPCTRFQTKGRENQDFHSAV